MRLLVFLFCFGAVSYAQKDTVFRIYFDFGKYTPSSETNPFLKLDTNLWQPQVQLTGKTDTTGNAEFNRYLADFRLTAVKQFIQKVPYFSVTQSTIAGETAPKKPYNASRERCVEVRLIRKKRSPGMRINSTFPDPLKEDEPLSSRAGIPKNFHPDSIISKGDVLVLKNILFEMNETILLSESYVELEQLLKVMKENPNMRIHIRGHVCCAPSMELSLERAKKIYNYLIRNGISDDRMTYQGYSNKSPHPLYKHDLYLQEHRRVEIEVLER